MKLFYQRLKKDPTPDHQSKIRAVVRSLQDKGSINQRTAQDLVETKVKAAHFYILPKIHKSLDNPPGRPIVSSNQCPTERISPIVDLHLKPLVSALPSYIRDTKDFLFKLESLLPLPPGAILFTMDVVGLYTNIPHDGGLTACEQVLQGRACQVPPTADIISLAKLVLELNSFTSNKQHYLQICGTAMGTRMAPSYANLFMGVLEKKILATAPYDQKPLFYGRFIDDVFGVWVYGEGALLEFFQHANSAHPNIRFTYTFGKMVDYLDATLRINGQSITSDLFTKPTDTHQYLLPSSDHPPHVHRHLPFGLGMRLRAIVSDDANLEDRLAELTGFLKARGYSEDLVKSQLTKVHSIPRSQTLSSSRRHTKDNNNRIPLVCRWNSHLSPLDKLLRESFPILQSNPHLRNTFDLPLVAYKRPRNLRDLLTSRPRADPNGPSKDRQNGTFPCEVARCKTCEVVRNIETFRYKTN